MTSPQDGLYRITFPQDQVLTAFDPRHGAPLVLLPAESGAVDEWRIDAGPDGYTICLAGRDLFVSFDGDPDVHEPAVLLPAARAWTITPAVEPDTFSIGVPGTPMRLGLSLLRIFPPRIALASDLDDRYQAWTFKQLG